VAKSTTLQMSKLLLLLAPATCFAAMPTVKLSNGVEMPLLLFGTPSCGKPEPNSCAGNATSGAGLAAKEALTLGFTGVDTAHHYMNQRGVAAGIKASGASRVWVTSKIEACNNSFVRWGHCGADTAARFEDNLAQLGATSVDLMLLHAPTGTSASVYPIPPRSPSCNCSSPAACAAMQEQWAVLEKMYKAKKARAIGVSNYCTACLDCIAAKSTVTPHVNQIRGEDTVAAAVAARIAAP